MSNRISQLPVEVLILPDTSITFRLSQLPVEAVILSNAIITFRLSQLPIEILIDTSIIPPTDVEKSYAYVDEIIGLG